MKSQPNSLEWPTTEADNTITESASPHTNPGSGAAVAVTRFSVSAAGPDAAVPTHDDATGPREPGEEMTAMSDVDDLSHDLHPQRDSSWPMNGLGHEDVVVLSSGFKVTGTLRHRLYIEAGKKRNR